MTFIGPKIEGLQKISKKGISEYFIKEKINIVVTGCISKLEDLKAEKIHNSMITRFYHNEHLRVCITNTNPLIETL